MVLEFSMTCTDGSFLAQKLASIPMFYILQQSAQHFLSFDVPRLLLETEHLFLQTEIHNSYQTAVIAATSNINKTAKYSKYFMPFIV